MRLATSGFYDAAARRFGALSEKADLLQTQVATGKKLQAPSDDALAFRRLQGLAREGANAAAYEGNLKVAAGVLAQADTALSTVGDQLVRARELALQAANGTLNRADRGAIATELAGIVETLAGLANRTDLRGQPLFGGADGGAAAVRRADGSWGLASTPPGAIPVGDGQSVQATEAAARVFGFEGKDGPTDAIAVVAALAAALAGEGDPAGATATGIDDLAAAGEQVTNAQASLGARAARVEMMQAQLADAAADREAARSGMEDADIAATVTELQKTMTILQATQASFAKLSKLSLFDYLR